MTEIPDTYEDLAWKLVKMLPLGYSRIDIVCDTYQEKSLKSYERNKRGVSSKIIVQSHKSKIPRDFKGFLKNGDNKTRLTELVREVLSFNKTKVLDMLRTEEIFFSTFNDCKRITADSISTEDRLVSNQEEADTKVLLHCLHSLTCNQEKNVIVRSPSGDVDITVIMISKLLNNADRVFLDYGTGIHRKGMWLSDVDMPESEKKCLIGFHAFTGNDYISSFFRKGKTACWKIVEKNSKFVEVFASLGCSWNLQDNVFNGLEEYVCYLYGFRKKDINYARHELFQRTYSRDNKITDLSLLPPCQSTLKLHASRANVVAKLWKSADETNVCIPDAALEGWDENLQIHWLDNAFPENVIDILMDSDFDSINEDIYGTDEESDKE